jgi:hypothetical protein
MANTSAIPATKPNSRAFRRLSDLMHTPRQLASCRRVHNASQRPLPSGCSPQIPAAARMLGINPSTCVQVALVKIPRAGRGRGPRRRTPTAIGIGGINPSIPVQIAPVIILAAGLGVGCTYVRRCRRDHSYRQRGQESEDPKAHDGIFLSAPGGGYRPNHVIGSYVPLPVCCYTSAPSVQRNFMLANLTNASPASAGITSKMEHALSAWGE